jgi:site-specific DNA-methyltransferase (adenine-specific)
MEFQVSGMKKLAMARLDENGRLHDRLLKYCRLREGEVWTDPEGRHRIGCLDAAELSEISRLMGGEKAALAIHDPPYNMVAFERTGLEDFIKWCARWVDNTDFALAGDGSFYVWLGADQSGGFEPLADFMIMMRGGVFKSRSFITMRNQRGYGTQKNWMAVRQELLYYVKGKPIFNVDAEYTDIPKILRGYYKDVNGETTENLQRSKSKNIRAGNVWVDIQQVFYRMEENVNGCYAQKPIKSCVRIIRSGSNEGDIVVDFFCHSGSTLIGCEMLKRKCYTIDVDPVYCEIAIRRLEHYRVSGKTGWQNGNAFEKELSSDAELRELAGISDGAEAEAMLS